MALMCLIEPFRSRVIEIGKGTACQLPAQEFAWIQPARAEGVARIWGDADRLNICLGRAWTEGPMTSWEGSIFNRC